MEEMYGTFNVYGTDERCMQNVRWKTDHLEDLVTVRSIILKWFVKKQGVRIQTGVVCFRIESSYVNMIINVLVHKRPEI